MKKKVLSAAIVAAMGVGNVQAVSISHDGTGEVAIVPLWTVMSDPGMADGGENDSKKTNLSIVNTTGETKAVKVRFREGYNSADVFDFNVYLSPYDVWTASVVNDPAGARITTADNSCTAPDLSSNNYTFLPYRFSGIGTDGGPESVERLRQGHAEIFEMAVINDPDAKYAIVHDGAGFPNDCDSVRAAWTGANSWNTYWAAKNTATPYVADTEPTGGLAVAASIIHVSDGTEISVPVTHLKSFSAQQTHVDPSTDTPNLGGVNPATSVVITNDGINNQGMQVWQDDWDTGPDRAIDAVSALFQTASISNEFTINPAVGAETAWVVTFPTKYDYVNLATVTIGATTRYPVREPFTDSWLSGSKACESVGYTVWDREEAMEDATLLPSPKPIGVDGALSFCTEVNVLNFEGSDPLFAAGTGLGYDLGGIDYINGWAKLTFDRTFGTTGTNYNVLHNAITGRKYMGLPAIGFRVTTLSNPNAGVGAYYGTAVSHVVSRVVNVSDVTLPYLHLGQGNAGLPSVTGSLEYVGAVTATFADNVSDLAMSN